MDSINNIQTAILSDIIHLFQCEKDIDSHVNQTLIKYKDVEDIENLMIQKIDVYENDYLFFKQMKKEFKYILLSCGKNLNTKGFQCSMNYYIALVLLKNLESIQDKRFIKELFILIINSFSLLPNDEDQTALQILFYLKLVQSIPITDNRLIEEEKVRILFYILYRQLLLKEKRNA